MKNRGYTLLEMVVVILMLMMILTVVSSAYVNLVKATILANDYYQALENVRLGTEKIWRSLKYGWNFRLVGNSEINFKDKNCATTTINWTGIGGNLRFCTDSVECSFIFDSNLVRVNNFLIATDTPNTNRTDFYFQYAPKIIVLYYNLELISRRGLTTTLEFQQAVAPLNSVSSRGNCPP
jgi:type II secretory pathway pseudopilin PulG